MAGGAGVSLAAEVLPAVAGPPDQARHSDAFLTRVAFAIPGMAMVRLPDASMRTRLEIPR
jgi:hypothetical protein